mgnify:CR=1 FL=1
MMKPLTHRLPHLVAAIALGAGLVACQTTPRPNADLEAARDAVSRAGTEPNAARAAAVELDQAHQALRRAESAWFDRRDGDETQHLSYLALRRAETDRVRNLDPYAQLEWARGDWTWTGGLRRSRGAGSGPPGRRTPGGPERCDVRSRRGRGTRPG